MSGLMIHVQSKMQEARTNVRSLAKLLARRPRFLYLVRKNNT